MLCFLLNSLEGVRRCADCGQHGPHISFCWQQVFSWIAITLGRALKTPYLYTRARDGPGWSFRKTCSCISRLYQTRVEVGLTCDRNPPRLASPCLTCQAQIAPLSKTKDYSSPVAKSVACLSAATGSVTSPPNSTDHLLEEHKRQCSFARAVGKQPRTWSSYLVVESSLNW
jgi:hypothetical protein